MDLDSRKRRRRGLVPAEQLEARRVLASLAGSVVVDHDGGRSISDGDTPVRGALVWVDSDRDAVRDAQEPTAYTDADGGYRFDDLPAGSHLIRYQPTPGLFQTSPSEHFAFRHDPSTVKSSIATIDVDSGAVSRKEAGALNSRAALIKTIDGSYYSAGFRDELLYRIDPTTQTQTLVGLLDQEIVAGLAYDPVMDEIYTLARETDECAPPLRLYQVNRDTAELVPVSDHVPELDGLSGTTSLAFDWINREVVLYENFTDKLYAYDLAGHVRELSSVAPKPFYNLSFDGHRFLAVYNDNGQRIVGEVDLQTGELTPVVTLDNRVNGNAGDILAANHPHEILIVDDQSAVTGVDFLSGQMRLGEATLSVTPTEIILTSDHLRVTQPLDPNAPAIDLSIEAEALQIEVSQTTTSSFSIRLSDNDQQVSIGAVPSQPLDMGGGRDTLAINADEHWDLTGVADELAGIDRLDLSGPEATELVFDGDAVERISDEASWQIVAGAEDQLEFAGEGWQASKPAWSEGARLHRLTTDRAIVDLTNDRGWQNPLAANDVDRNGEVTALDALLVINLLGRIDSQELEPANLAVRDAPYVDTTGDNTVSALDALRVINGIPHGV